MDPRWTASARNEDERNRRLEVLRGYKPAFDDLKEMIERYRKEPAFRDYNSTNWHLEQIARNEYNAALDDILNLLEITNDSRNSGGQVAPRIPR